MNGTCYPPFTIYSLLSAFQRIMQNNKLPFRLFDSRDLRFADFTVKKEKEAACDDKIKKILAPFSGSTSGN